MTPVPAATTASAAPDRTADRMADRKAENPGGALRRLGEALSRLLQRVGGLALVVMVGWTVVDVVSRLLFRHPLPGSIDLVESTLVLVVFCGLAEGFRRGEQITVDIFDHAVPPRLLVAMRLLGAVAALAFLGLLAWAVWAPLVDAYRFGDTKPDLPIPIYPLLLAIETGIVVTITATLPSAVRLAVTLIRGGSSS